jgi:hypothetical protein
LKTFSKIAMNSSIFAALLRVGVLVVAMSQLVWAQAAQDDSNTESNAPQPIPAITLTLPDGSAVNLSPKTIIRIRRTITPEDQTGAKTRIDWIQIVREAPADVAALVEGYSSIGKLIMPEGSPLWFNAAVAQGPMPLPADLFTKGVRSAILLGDKMQYLASTPEEVRAELADKGGNALPIPAPFGKTPAMVAKANKPQVTAALESAPKQSQQAGAEVQKAPEPVEEEPGQAQPTPKQVQKAAEQARPTPKQVQQDRAEAGKAREPVEEDAWPTREQAQSSPEQAWPLRQQDQTLPDQAQPTPKQTKKTAEQAEPKPKQAKKTPKQAEKVPEQARPTKQVERMPEQFQQSSEQDQRSPEQTRRRAEQDLQLGDDAENGEQDLIMPQQNQRVAKSKFDSRDTWDADFMNKLREMNRMIQD